ncbi:MAG: 3-dehydroquinate synthase [Frankiaceae bacterium]|nr:3-dehydroquinate synthase [Frankiaceae bacterium]
MKATTDEVTTIPVGGPTPYDVLVGNGLSQRLPPLVDGASTVALVSAGPVGGVVDRLADVLARSDHRVVRVEVVAGEAGKSLDSVADVWDAFGNAPLSRTDAVVAVGGGATTDLAGFAAATWLRGVRVVHVPTTLLGMVDAAIGGKTAVNTAAGKNLVGAFHPPAGVLVDLDLLDSLPVAEWVNGLAEVVKAGFVADPAILDAIEDDVAGARRPDGPSTRDLIERSIRMKAAVVSADLRETGLREVLNYGHTLGHAIERVEQFRWPHGHAVSVGLVFAAALGRAGGRLDAATADRHRTVLEALGLPTTYRSDVWPQLLDAMRVDKKARADRLRFVVLDGLARPGILEEPDMALLETAFAEVAR